VEDGLVPDSHAIIVHAIGACIRVKPRLDEAVTGSVEIVVTAISSDAYFVSSDVFRRKIAVHSLRTILVRCTCICMWIPTYLKTAIDMNFVLRLTSHLSIYYANIPRDDCETTMLTRRDGRIQICV
jgi:hypothetical protein